ncbi:MAG: pyrrolysine--tRNA(Pyl) ligase small subunit [Thermincola ferriacetica]
MDNWRMCKKEQDYTKKVQALDVKDKKRYYRKNVEFFKLLEKIKLWPSRSGTLHGIKTITIRGNTAEIVTHCNERFIVRNSRNSRAARWLRNKWHLGICRACRVPEWKLEKYSATGLNQFYGSNL